MCGSCHFQSVEYWNWRRILIVYFLVFSYVKKKKESLWNFFIETMQPFRNLEGAQKVISKEQFLKPLGMLILRQNSF